MKKIVFLLVLISILCVSCNTKQKNNGDIFYRYFGEELKLNPENNEVFVLVLSAQGCSSCYKGLFEALTFYNPKKLKNTRILITDKSGYYEKYNDLFDKYGNRIFLDNENVFLRMDLPIQSSGILYVKDKVVVKGLEYNTINAPNGFEAFLIDFQKTAQESKNL